jgi:DNA-binding MarR family transcriptional regulator
MSEQRYDLGAMFVRLGSALVAAEQPVLDEHGLRMWDYVVLLALQAGPAQSQSRLSELTGRDRTRLIPILDRLVDAGLVLRQPDPADRRHHIVRLTDAGRAKVLDCQRGIREMERQLLGELPESDRASFVALLERVTELVAPWPG